MAEGKLDRALDLSSDESLRGKGSLTVGLEEEKATLGFVDEFKDQQSSENIPLSPQWLYAKPTEIKDGRPQNLPEVPQENKRERRRSMLETENSQSTRRWREEERETGLLGRRGDRPKKESDPPARNPNPGNPTKWSSRWGPDDHRDKERETQIRQDKKPVDVLEKEQHEANPNPSSNPTTEKFATRPLAETDSRDKWRPRHRQEGPVATYRVAPGFGSERGGAARQEPTTNVGFAAGRGRSSSSLGRVGPIGASPMSRGGGDNVGKISFRYPRARLLDIYRKNRFVKGNNEDAHVGFEAVPSVTLPSEVSPLAFLEPDNEEKVTLEEIYKGNLTSSGTDPRNADPSKKHNSSRIESTFLSLGEEKYARPITAGISNPELDANQHTLDIGLVEDPFSEFTEKSMFSKSEAQDVGHFESSVNLPDDSSLLFDTPIFQYKPEYLEKSPSPPLEEVSLYYQDPQGGIQGPFLGIDIISWFQEGYFGLDLPVCPTDAPEGTPYRPLGEVMPQLRQKMQSVEVSAPVPVATNNDAGITKPLGGSFEHNNRNELAPDGSEVPLEGGVGWAPQPDQVDPVAVSRFGEQWSQGASTGMENEEVIYVGRPKSSMGTSQAIKQTSENTESPPRASSNEPLYGAMSEVGDSSQLLPDHNLQVPRSATPSNDNINPLGLLWSELESSQSKHPLSSSLPPNYRKPDPLKDLNLQPRMHHSDLETSHFTLEEKLLSEQLQRQQLQQLQQEQLFARSHGGRSQASELEQLFKLQYELEQQRKMQLQQERLQQERLQQERLQQERLIQERARREQQMMIRQQQQIQEQLLLEQMLQQQLQQERLQQERLQEQQMLREQQFLNELQRAQHIQRQQQDAAIEQLIQAKFGPASQRQMISPSIEQQLLLGLQQRDPIQAQQLALALRQQQEQQRLEEEIMLRGVRPTGPSAHHAPSLHRSGSSRISQLERSLSLHEQLQSMERSMSLNAGLTAPSPRNVEFAQTLAQLELQERQLQERQLRERQLQERQQRAMFGSPGGHLDQFWPDPNSNPGAAQLERSLIESHLSHQLQLEAESKMRVRKPGSGLEDAHLWGPQEVLNDVMYHQNMHLHSPHGSYKDSSLLFNPNPSPNTNSVLSMEAMQSGIRPGSSSGPGSFVEKDLYGNRGELQNEEMGNPNPIPMANNDVQFFDNFGEAVIKTDQEPVRAPTPGHASFGSSDDAIFTMGEDVTAFGEETVDSRPRGISRADSRTGSSIKINEADQQHQAAPRPPSRPASADASRQESRGGIHKSETQGSSKKEVRLLRAPSSSGGESDTAGPTFIEMLKSTKKPPQPATQLDDMSESGPGGKGAKKKGKKGRQIDPSLLGFKVHSNRIMMGEIQRPDE
ncbi:hypothetical protein LUZ63_003829 [Rhynchospora breviuscula]|uniref:GYF domain-containing protein n=1 Tax=Rhynchospora breviuscula TaxID=2022672 RepID=A0A9Q0D1D0_9POAL|nr:hypothetical protein LUZ63_003829 [Rhynchospora breviuscula]